MKLRQAIMLKIMNFYPPFLGAGIRADVDKHGKIEPEFKVDIYDEQNQIVASVTKVIHIHVKKGL